MGVKTWRSLLPGPVAAKLGGLFHNTIKENWYLGFTSFGGPPVHFKIFHDKFTTKLGWIDEQVYQELFGIAQAISGPASTKMHYCINLIHDGFPAAVLAFLIWSLPGALGMYGLSVGVSNIHQSLPRAVYALLSGLNAATVGIIALAAVQLAQKAITDKMTRVLVVMGATAGMLYNALWYFPLLLIIAGVVAVIHDFRWLHRPVKAVWGVLTLQRLRKKKKKDGQQTTATTQAEENGSGVVGGGADTTTTTTELESTTPLERAAPPGVTQDASGNIATTSPQRRSMSIQSAGTSRSRRLPISNQEAQEAQNAAEEDDGAAATYQEQQHVVPPERQLNMSWQHGLAVIALFLVSFVVVMVLRGVLPSKPILYRLFANMYLAGTIIFGGGPVVIPLLREYVVAEGWVSPRDFIIGLALIQGFPGPNFNFAVYLGGLTAANAGVNPAAGAVLGYLGIFVPGMVIVHGTVGVWGAMRSRRGVRSALRGVNAAAVGLIFTAVYRIWQIGWIDEGFEAGTSLANDPWWVVVTATSYVGGAWFNISSPVAIIIGAALGLVRYGVVVS